MIKNKRNTSKLQKALKDLFDTNQKMADKYGCTISIGTDDHMVEIARPRKSSLSEKGSDVNK